MGSVSDVSLGPIVVTVVAVKGAVICRTCSLGQANAQDDLDVTLFVPNSGRAFRSTPLSVGIGAFPPLDGHSRQRYCCTSVLAGSGRS